MGVHGLWTVVQPCARPIKLETLNKKRLAVDASIWIYQFLKAVRDKEGNALRNSHVVGFFRRICKLLYFGIKPVFVFDGGAPVLKRQTIAGRKKRREGRREDAVRTAGKLLAVQLQRTAEEEAASRRRGVAERQEEEVPDNPVYADEALMTEKEKSQNRSFRKKDAYHLPDMHGSFEEMGAPNDPRIMSQDELEEYAKQFHQGEEVNLYDFSKIDFDGPFFMSLPATDRYNILNAARLRSRLRMGYSKEQLDNMFPDRMAFSKFQIERVKERNDLTQRLMNINGMNGEEAFYKSGQRIAGERGKEYVLVKDNSIEGGWVLGVVGNKEGQEDKPIDVDQYGQEAVFVGTDDASDDDDGGFEDVPIEGLNRLPRLPFLQEGVLDESVRSQMRGSTGRGMAIDDVRGRSPILQDVSDDSLFVESGLYNRNRNEVHDMFNDSGDDEDERLQRAIAMSLETEAHGNDDTDLPEIPINRNHAPLPPPGEGELDLDQSDDEEMDFSAALAQSRRVEKEPSRMVKNSFDGPLPFESLKLGKPFGGKPKDKDQNQKGSEVDKETKPAKPPKEIQLPPWFSKQAERPNGIEFAADRVAVDDVPKKPHGTNPTPDHLFVNETDEYASKKAVKPLDTKEIIDLDPQIDEEVSNMATQDTPVMRKAPPAEETVPTKNDAIEPENNKKLLHMDNTTPTEAHEGIAEDSAKSQLEAPADTARFEASPSPEFEDVVPHAGEETANDTLPVVEPTVSDEIDLTGEYIDQEEFSDPEDADLLQQLAAEGEEHVRFAATLNPTTNLETAFEYEQELKQLRFQQKKDRRDADEVSQVMITECQQLLQLFGLPYITAPMEAEAQCAELVSLGLVDGIITDDSDIFLFGGTRVYKNMFNQGKFVECYLTTDLEKEYSLFRRKLIRLAHLLGSDYTEGIPGVGPVTALEVLTEFATLEEFRDWWTQVQMGANMDGDAHAAFYKKFKKQAAKLFLPPSFPDPRVDVAYLEPEVDSDPSSFQWGVPDLHGLRNFLMSTVGWSQERTDEILLPVIRDMNQREQEGTQSNITSFFSGPLGAGAFAPRVRAGGQTRMEKAFSRLRKQAVPVSDAEEDPTADDSSHPSRKETGTKRGRRPQNAKKSVDGPEDESAVTTKKRKTRRGAKS
ncbi:PIN domain-like protein [Aspergillus heteromorphus CBS 117.55]|uniref:PIN domain-like protein n=1 Tax=Aspergillus heteromorphus CBS 117.55 TaxID=1448321 RepID=A0A317W0V7_9EURO|nr:PIN domain-like protein [Aspergillus heteromorphus CBS 117.55]PWY79231.1 PIN domain-like protein [Aspergillus heteromorphus CBS 117.55]